MSFVDLDWSCKNQNYVKMDFRKRNAKKVVPSTARAIVCRIGKHAHATLIYKTNRQKRGAIV